MRRTLYGTTAEGGRPEFCMTKSGKLSASNAENLKILGDLVVWEPLCFCDAYLQELYQVLTINNKEKSSPPPSRGRRKGATVEDQSILFFFRGTPFRRNCFARV